jgi:sterol desaturase/sphingolipid hydroxylase (fatty acid hydroxylase superfamily)
MDFTPMMLLDVAVIVFALFFGHFLIVAAGAYGAIWMAGRDALAHRRIQLKPLRDAKPRRELAFSTLSIAIFTVLLTGLWVLDRLGVGAIYWDVAEHGWGWFVASIALMALIHDSYYYWAHRFMHHPKVFRHVHKLHHGFHNPTPFASYAFHPWEAVVEVAWVAPVALLLPIHPGAFACYVVFLTVLNVISHLGYEFYPSWIARWFITSTHHNMHHTRAKGHFMLYFNIWDRIMGTNEADYVSAIDEINARPKPQRGREGAPRDSGDIEVLQTA